jgi:hypothetical protein
MSGLGVDEQLRLSRILRRSVVLAAARQGSGWRRAYFWGGAIIGFASFVAGPIWFVDPTVIDKSAVALTVALVGYYAFFLNLSVMFRLPATYSVLLLAGAAVFVLLVEWLFRDLPVSVILALNMCVAVSCIGLMIGRLLFSLFHQFVAAPLMARHIGILAPIEVAAVRLHYLLVAFEKSPQPWRKTPVRRQLSLAIRDTIRALQREVAVAASAGGAGPRGRLVTRRHVDKLATTLGGIQTRLMDITSADDLAELRSAVAEAQRALLQGTWPESTEAAEPIRSRLASIVRPVTRVLVPILLAVALPVLPGLHLPSDAQRLAQVVLVLDAVLSLPWFDTTLRDSVTTKILGK